MRFIIPEIPPSLNQFAGRENEWAYRKAKAYWMELCCAYCRPKPVKPLERARVTLEYHFPDRRRRDPDNYIKLIMDGLVKAGVIQDDSFDNVELVLKQGSADKKPHVIIEIKEV